MLSKKEQKELFARIYGGIISAYNLPPEVYFANFEALKTAISVGFDDVEFEGAEDIKPKVRRKKRNLIRPSSPEEMLFRHYRRNVSVFSAAKTFKQVADMSDEVFGPDGLKRSFADFKKKASEIFDDYNVRYLEAEFATAANASIQGRRWLDIQRNVNDLAAIGESVLLKYQTVGDERVRPAHVVLDNIIKPVGHPFWRTHFPPNGWRCRCDTTELVGGDEPETPDEDLNGLPSLPPLFDYNPGLDKIIFSPKHPYFKVENRFEILKENDFNLPVVPPFANPVPFIDFVPVNG